MSLRAVEPPILIQTRTADSLAWMRLDLIIRVIPFGALVLAVSFFLHPTWLGLSGGDIRAQLGIGIPGALLIFVAAAMLQLWITRRVRGTVKVPGGAEDLSLHVAYFLVNAFAEEAFFRGLLQGGLTALGGPALGLAVATPAYVLYHRLGGWRWADVLATALAGVPLAIAFWLLPGPPSLLGVVLIHFGATAGFLGLGPWLLRRLGLL